MDDVEAILANMDSDEEGEVNLQGLNIEDILREAEDGDDDQALAQIDKAQPELIGLEAADLGHLDSSDINGEGRNQEEWAILQEILKEAEEEELEEDEGSFNADAIEKIISSFDSGEDDAVSQVVMSIPLPVPPDPDPITHTVAIEAKPPPVETKPSEDPATSPIAPLIKSPDHLNQIKPFPTLRSFPAFREAKVGPQRSLEAAELREHKFLKLGNRDLMSPLQVKRRMRPKASRQEGQGCPSGMVRIETVEAITKQLVKNAQYVSHGPGVPTAIAIHPKFIAIGTKRGLVLLFDHFHEVRNVLGNTTEADLDGAVTSLDFSSSQDLLVTGFKSGKVVLWDFLKGQALKPVTDAHKTPIISVRFASTKDPSVVSMDVMGIVNKLNFSKMLWGAYVVDTECLLDGKAGQIPSIAILPQSSLTAPIEPKTTAASLNPLKASGKPLSLIGLSSEKSSFIVSIEPQVKVLHKWEKPADQDVVMGDMPCITWNWVSERPGEAAMTPILARCWGKKLQLLRCHIVREGVDSHNVTFDTAAVREAVFSKATLAVEWIGTTLLGVLDRDYQLRILDATTLHPHDVVDLTTMHLLALNFTPAGMVEPPFQGGGGAEEGRPHGSLETYQNSFRRGDGRLYMLGRRELRFAGLQTWSQRIDVYVNQGEWLEALALALDHYENDVATNRAAADSTKLDASGETKPLPSPLRPTMLNSTDIQIADLLLQYVRLAMENAPKAGMSSLRRSHFQLLSGVCVEYCMVIGRLDLLYGEIFNSFVAAGQVRTFLDMLEPYLLNEKVRHIGPEVLLSLIEHCQDKNDLPTVERCLLHMDVTELDFDHVLTLLGGHKMFSGLTYVYSRGLGDYLTPLEMMLQEMTQRAASVVRKEAEGEVESEGGGLESQVEVVGLKALLFLLYCFQGRIFPSGTALPEADMPKLSSKRTALLKLIFQPTATLPADAFIAPCELKALGEWPYLRLLLCLDAKAVLETLSLAFDSEDVNFTIDDEGAFVSPRKPEEAGGSDGVKAREETTTARECEAASDEAPCISKEQICEILAAIIDPEISALPAIRLNSPFLSRACTTEVNNLFLEFLAAYMEKGHISMRSARMSNAVLQHLASPYAVKRGACQERMVKLLQRLPLDFLEIDQLLPLTRKNGFLRAELFLREAAYDLHLKATRPTVARPSVSTTTNNAGGAIQGGMSFNPASASENHLACAIRCYLKDPDLEFRRKVFEFLGGVVAQVHGAIIPFPSPLRPPPDVRPGQDSLAEVKRTILEEMPGLFALDRGSFLRLTTPLFAGDPKAVLQALEASGHQELQFQYLDALVKGENVQGGQDGLEMQAATPVMPVQLNSQDLLLYVKLMAKYRPTEVYQYVTSSHSYPLDECLRICQQDRRLMDATAYLLERTGDVEGALQMLLVAITERTSTLRTVVRQRLHAKQFHCFLDHHSGPNAREQGTMTPAVLRRKGLFRKVMFENMEEGKALEKIVMVAIDLCQRNSSGVAKDKRYDERVARLWFALLDRLLQENALFKPKASEPPQNSVIMQAVLTELLQVALDRMMGFVPLPEIVKKLTTDHASNSLGDFRDIFLSMFETYTYEHNIYGTGVSLMTNTLYRLIKQKHRLKGSGICVRSIENVTLPITKNPHFLGPVPKRGTGIRVLAKGTAFFEKEGGIQPSSGSRITSPPPPIVGRLPGPP